MLPVVIARIPDEEQLLQQATKYRPDCKVAPAYMLYLCTLHRSTKRNLKPFLNKTAHIVYGKIESVRYITEEAFWLANASELLHFFKYDKSLGEHSKIAQECLTITIQTIFHNLLSNFVQRFRSAADSHYMDETISDLNLTTAALEEFHVNVGLINQFLSFLLQWITRKLIANIEDPPSYYAYFKKLNRWAVTMDDESLINRVKEFSRLIEDDAQNVEGASPVNVIKLKLHPPRFLEEYDKGTYNSFIEEAAKLLVQTIGGKTHLEDEPVTFQLLIPYTGYSCHNVTGIPDWMEKLFRPLHENGCCTLNSQQESSGNWTVRLNLTGQPAERLTLTNIQFKIQPNFKICKDRVAHITGLSFAVSNLTIGDQILSIHGETVDTEQDKDIVIKKSLGRIKLDVVKIGTCKVFLQTSTSANKVHTDETAVPEATLKFNLVESSERSSKEDVSESINSEHAEIFQAIISEVDGLNSMLEEFDGNSENDRSYTYMKEIMMRNIIKLDNMDTGDSREVKEKRRSVIYFIQDKIEQLKVRLVANQEKNKNDIDVNRDRKQSNHEYSRLLPSSHRTSTLTQEPTPYDLAISAINSQQQFYFKPLNKGMHRCPTLFMSKVTDVKMLPVVIARIPDEEQLLQQATKYRPDCKVAPAYMLYLCALHRSTKRNLKPFLNKTAHIVYGKIESVRYITEEAFWLANASELLHFFKYDKSLGEHSKIAQECLTITIQAIFHNLLSNFVQRFRSAADSHYMDETISDLNLTTAALEEFHVNVGLINQFLSFLLQWITRKLIANIEDPPSYYAYFKKLNRWAVTMDDESLINRVKEFSRLIEDDAQNVEGASPVNVIKLKLHSPRFLEKYDKGTYNSFIEEAAKLLVQTIGGKTHLEDKAVTFQLLIPYTGYSCHNVTGIPDWMDKLFKPLHEKGCCTLNSQQESSGNWTVRLNLTGQPAERLTLTKIQFKFQPNFKICKDRLAHITGLSFGVSNLTIGDQILSIHGETVDTEQDKDIVIKKSLGRIKLDVVKIGTCKVFLQTSTSANKVHAEETAVPEATLKFNLVESSARSSTEDVSESIHNEHAEIFQAIISEVDGLNSMLEEFNGNSENDRSYTYMKEIMMRNIIKLDNMDTGDSREVKEKRRSVIYFIQDKIEQLKVRLIANQEKNKNDIDVTRDRKQSNHDYSTKMEAKETKTAPPAEELTKCIGQTLVNIGDIYGQQEIPTKHQLLCETKYDLNLLQTKFVSTGIYPSSQYNVPAIEFSVGSLHLLLGMPEWQALLSFEHLLRDFSQNRITHKMQENIGSYELHLEPNYLSIKNKNEFFYLEPECVHNLLQLNRLITSRMNLVENYCKQFQLIILGTPQLLTDPFADLELQLINMNPEISHLIREYVHFYPEIIMKNVEMIRKGLQHFNERRN